MAIPQMVFVAQRLEHGIAQNGRETRDDWSFGKGLATYVTDAA